jgi:hypothetical protein
MASSASLRRSTESAIEPPTSPRISTGMNVKPSAPTANDDLDKSQTWSETANPVIEPPTVDNRLPASRRRNAGCWPGRLEVGQEPHSGQL